MNYLVNYGVNNSHLTENKPFELYRDAKKFYEKLGNEYQAKICFKLIYGYKENSLSKFVIDKEIKLFKFESGTDNTLMINTFIL